MQELIASLRPDGSCSKTPPQDAQLWIQYKGGLELFIECPSGTYSIPPAALKAVLAEYVQAQRLRLIADQDPIQALDDLIGGTRSTPED